MENFSKNKKRGRPRKYTLVDVDNGLFDDMSGMSRRSHVNAELEIRAMSALGFFEEGEKRAEQQKKYAWLFPFTEKGYTKQGRKTVLYDLGRIVDEDGNADDESIRLLADHICEKKMSTKDAREFIRLVRRAVREEMQNSD